MRFKIKPSRERKLWWFMMTMGAALGVFVAVAPSTLAMALIFCIWFVFILSMTNHWAFLSVYKMHYPYSFFYMKVYHKLFFKGIDISPDLTEDTYKTDKPNGSNYFLSDLTPEMKQRLKEANIAYWYDRRIFIFAKPQIYFRNKKSRAYFALMSTTNK